MLSALFPMSRYQCGTHKIPLVSCAFLIPRVSVTVDIIDEHVGIDRQLCLKEAVNECQIEPTEHTLST